MQAGGNCDSSQGITSVTVMSRFSPAPAPLSASSPTAAASASGSYFSQT